MKTTAAHLLRRIARKCIAWSNKLEPVRVNNITVNSGIQAGIDVGLAQLRQSAHIPRW